jgi:hypothetical protein
LLTTLADQSFGDSAFLASHDTHPCSDT